MPDRYSADAVERLLATRRPSPSSRDWQPRASALYEARRGAPASLVPQVQNEIDAMWDARSAWRERQRRNSLLFRDDDYDAMQNCRYRHPLVRGLTSAECRAAKQCFLCAGPVPARRHHWCSDRCIRLWDQNHYWRSTVWAATARDKGCVRPGPHKGPLECNHKVPRNGRGYHPGCHHHLASVEMLCHGHHVIETVLQGRARRAR